MNSGCCNHSPASYDIVNPGRTPIYYCQMPAVPGLFEASSAQSISPEEVENALRKCILMVEPFVLLLLLLINSLQAPKSEPDTHHQTCDN